MSKKAIHVGDEVQFLLAGRRVVGRVIENRGPIGVGGRHLYLITFEMEKDNPFHIELPGDDLEVIRPKKEPA